jgi:cardiolipin synthase
MNGTAAATPGIDWSWLPALPWALLFTLLGELIAIVFLTRVIRRGGSTSVTLNWTFVILAAPWVGIAIYYLLPHSISRRRLRRRRKRLAWIDPTLPSEDVAVRPRLDSDPVQRVLNNFDSDAVQRGNALRMLDSGAAFLAEMQQAIAGAQQFVHLQTYIFRPDAAGQEVLALLTQAARQGLEVRLLYDSFGSWSLKNRHLRELRAAGGKVAAFMPLLWRRRPFTLNLRNHRKLLVVDGEVAVLGGRNIGTEYLTDEIAGSKVAWLDAMMLVRGPAVARLHRTFVEDWCHATEEDLSAPRYFPRVDLAGRDTVGVVDTGPDETTGQLVLVLQQLIASARRRLDISTPYLIPSPVMLSAIELAGRRGVRVRIHTNGRAVENWLLHRAQRSYYAPLIAAGVAVYETQKVYTHTKLIIVDDRYVGIGSPNLDWRSAELNFELAIVAMRSRVVAEASALFEERLIGAGLVKEAPPTGIVDGLCRLASPLL